jgi:hypothetical protein
MVCKGSLLIPGSYTDPQSVTGVKFRVEEAHLGGIVVIPDPKNTRKRKVNTDKIIPTTISKSDKSDSITFGEN